MHKQSGRRLREQGVQAEGSDRTQPSFFAAVGSRNRLWLRDLPCQDQGVPPSPLSPQSHRLRAAALREAGYRAVPTVAGEAITLRARDQAEANRALVLQDGRLAFWDEALLDALGISL